MQSSSLPRIRCLEYEQFIAVYTAIAASNVVFTLRYFPNIKTITERSLKTYLKNRNFTKAAKRKSNKWNVRFPHSWLRGPLAGSWKPMFFFPLSFARKQAFIQSLKQTKILQRMLLGRLQTSHTLWPYLTRLWHDTEKDQSAIRPMTSLNNFYLRDQYPKPWCVWRPLNTSKVESKLLSCLTLESNAYQIHLDILFLSWCTLKG